MQIMATINADIKEQDRRQALTWYLQGAGKQGETFAEYLSRLGLAESKPTKSPAEIKAKTKDILNRYAIIRNKHGSV